jgi:hypothetical protein
MAETEPKRTSAETGFLSKALKVLAFPVAAVSGYWFAQTSIRNSAYDNAKFTGAVKGVSEPHRDALQKIGEKANAIIEKGKTFDLPKEVRPLFEEHAPLVTKRLEDLNLGTLRKQWGFTSKYQKQQAIMNGLTAAGIAIGAVLSIANMKSIQQAFNRQGTEPKTEEGPTR